MSDTGNQDRYGASWDSSNPEDLHRMLPEGNLLGQVRDISERRKDQDSVHANENLLSSIFRAAPKGIGVVTTSLLNRVRFCPP